MRTSLFDVLCQPVPEAAWLQATLPVKSGGLGIRDPTLAALPAYLANLLAIRDQFRNATPDSLHAWLDSNIEGPPKEYTQLPGAARIPNETPLQATRKP